MTVKTRDKNSFKIAKTLFLSVHWVAKIEKREKLMENRDNFRDVFLPPRKQDLFKQNHVNIFSSLDIVDSYYMTSTGSHCFD